MSNFQFVDGSLQRVAQEAIRRKLPDVQARLAAIRCPEHQETPAASQASGGDIVLSVPCCDAQAERMKQALPALFA